MCFPLKLCFSTQFKKSMLIPLECIAIIRPYSFFLDCIIESWGWRKQILHFILFIIFFQSFLSSGDFVNIDCRVQQKLPNRPKVQAKVVLEEKKGKCLISTTTFSDWSIYHYWDWSVVVTWSDCKNFLFSKILGNWLERPFWGFVQNIFWERSSGMSSDIIRSCLKSSKLYLNRLIFIRRAEKKRYL